MFLGVFCNTHNKYQEGNNRPPSVNQLSLVHNHDKPKCENIGTREESFQSITVRHQMENPKSYIGRWTWRVTRPTQFTRRVTWMNRIGAGACYMYIAEWDQMVTPKGRATDWGLRCHVQQVPTWFGLKCINHSHISFVHLLYLKQSNDQTPESQRYSVPVISIYLHDINSVVYGVVSLGRSLSNDVTC